MPPLEVTSLGDGVLQLQSRLWATNSVAVVDGSKSLVCDPSIFEDELAEIRACAGRSEPFVLITHSDWDHTCGIPAFADAVIAAGARTAQAVADGTADALLREGGDEWGLGYPGALHVDMVLEAGAETVIGAERVEVIDAPGHSPDGSAFLLLGQGLLLTGDYLSPASYPVLLGSLEEAIETHERLLAALDGERIRRVVPGHGPALTPAQAHRIAQEDVRYVRELRGAARRCLTAGASAGEAIVAAHAVSPPREDRLGLEAFGLRAGNARQAVAQARVAAAAGLGGAAARD